MRKCLLFAAMALFLNTLGCRRGDNATTALDWARKGESLRKADKKEQAVKAYDEAIKIDPNLEVAIFNRALIYSELSRDAEAAAARDVLVERKSPLAKQLQGLFALHSDVSVSFGNKNLQAGEWDRAATRFKVALVYEPNSSDAYVGLGLVSLGQKKFDEAVSQFDQAIKWNHQSAIAYHNRGIANCDLQQFKAAVADFNSALEFDPGNAQTHRARATAFEGLGDKSRAEDDRKKATELEVRDKIQPETK